MIFIDQKEKQSQVMEITIRITTIIAPYKIPLSCPKQKRKWWKYENKGLDHQIKDISICYNVLNINLPKKVITTKMNLNNYDKLTDPKK
jgi:hypothetical protein